MCKWFHLNKFLKICFIVIRLALNASRRLASNIHISWIILSFFFKHVVVHASIQARRSLLVSERTNRWSFPNSPVPPRQTRLCAVRWRWRGRSDPPLNHVYRLLLRTIRPNSVSSLRGSITPPPPSKAGHGSPKNCAKQNPNVHVNGRKTVKMWNRDVLFYFILNYIVFSKWSES